MPDVLTPTSPTTPTETVVVTTPTPTPTPTSATPPLGTPQDEARRALYEKHYGTTAQPPQDQVQAPPTETTAQVDPPADAVAPPATATPTPTDAILAAMQAMQAELAALKAGMPAPPTPLPEPTATEPSWIALLREGKVAEAEAALKDSIAKQVLPDAVAQAQAQTREYMRAEAELETFVRELRSANPELAPLEKFITSEANETLTALRAAGKILTTEDAVREYKKAVIEAKDNARKLYQQLRGAGKQEAMVRSTEVLSSTTLAPNSVDQSRTQAAPPSEPATETTEDYFAKRRAAESKARGLG